MAKDKVEKVDNVNHPKHYEGSTSLECIEVMEVVFGYEVVAFFCLCNAFKYMWRYKNKNGEEDIKKTGWYLNWVAHKLDLGYEFSDKLLTAHKRLNDLYITIGDKIANGGI